MDLLALALIVLAVVAGLIAFDLLALRFGVDSRESIGDDHARLSRT
jgi:hypothetical protein